MKKPNTFIIGAPKCGTSAMANYLNQHPDIYVSPVKEPHYFIEEDMPEKADIDYEQYMELFNGVTNESVILEASVWYLYGKNAIKNIYQFNPKSKIIIMLRRPDEMVYSMQNHAHLTRNDDLDDFDTAWSLNDSRKRGLNIPKHCRDKSMLFYDEIAKYSEQIERVYKYFDKKNVKIIFYDDLKENTEETYIKLLSFLGVKKIKLANYKTINKSKKIKNSFLGDFTRRPPAFFSSIVGFVKKITGIKELNILNQLRALNEYETKRDTLSKESKRKIIDNYSEDIRKLEVITNRDLKEWLK